MLRILLLGARGQLGVELSQELVRLGDVTALDRAAADLSEPESLRAIVRATRPQVLVNAAGYTAVDRAESERELATAVNAVAPGVLAEEAERLGACMVHYSTDYVFDGAKSEGYTETDEPNPLSVYGRTKREGEQAVLAACRRHLVLRTSWVFSAHGTNFLRTMLRLAGERDELRVVDDQRGAPTSTALLAGATAQAIASLHDATADDPRWGLYHLSAAGETSWHGFARHVIARAQQHGHPLRVRPGDVAAISTAEYPTAAARPANSRLDSSRFSSTFGLTLPHWTEGADRVLDDLTLITR